MKPPPAGGGRAVGLLAASGAVVGPLVDGLHNQVLLEYDVAPVSALGGGLETSLLIPPLLAATYVVLGSLLPRVARRVCGEGLLREPVAASDEARALLAVATTCAIVRLSTWAETLAAPRGLALLAVAAAAQWALLDGSLASLCLAALVGLAGPVAEIPFMSLGCWHYLQPDYFPLAPLHLDLPDRAAGLSSLTGPCYFAVATDAIALGRWFGVPRDAGDDDATAPQDCS